MKSKHMIMLAAFSVACGGVVDPLRRNLCHKLRGSGMPYLRQERQIPVSSKFHRMRYL